MSWRSKLVIIMIIVGLSARAPSEVVLESDDNAATFAGSWAQTTSALGFYGTDFAVAQGGGSADSARFFTPRPITTTGTWCIQARWTTGANRTTAAQYQVFDGPVLRTTFIVNQQVHGGAWRGSAVSRSPSAGSGKCG
jgi:hypothetical protein